MLTPTSSPAGMHVAPGARITLPMAVLFAGMAVLAAPTFVANYRQSWSTDQGAQGPVVLAMGIWLLARSWRRITSVGTQPPWPRVIPALLGSALLYLLGRVSDQFTLESYGLYAIGVTLLYGFRGGPGLRAAWFPLAYLAVALPVPYMLNMLLTGHLRLLVTQAAVGAARMAGLPIARDGLDILMDHYTLAVQDACSGMNSLFSLTAIGMLYIYLRRDASWPYILAMLVPIAVLAIVGNIVRVLILIGLTHFCGDAVAQGFLHEGAGVATFAVTLLLLIGLDAAAWPALRRWRAGRSARR